jgi:hypothetical protein
MVEPGHTPTRQRLPRRRVGLTHSVDIGGGAEVYRMRFESVGMT